MSKKLSDCIQGRDNNFNLIRIVAAFAVLIYHSFALARGPHVHQPFEVCGVNMGMAAVDVFFVISGFLVTASLLTRQNIVDFAWARILRIYPALLVMLFLTIFVLGMFFTPLPAKEYLAHWMTHRYIAKCATLFMGIDKYLPGVFSENPFGAVVNGSLWTMPYEINLYAVLAMIWLVLRVKKTSRARRFRLLIVTGCLSAGLVVLIQRMFWRSVDPGAMFAFMFLSGASYFVLKERLAVSRELFWLLLLTLISSSMISAQMFFVVYLVAVPYLLFCLAVMPAGAIRSYNQLGDYSYGVYIYAFPVQQSVAALIPGISTLLLVAISAFVTLILAMLSWHFVERHALALKSVYAERTRRLINCSVVAAVNDNKKAYK